MDLKHSSGWWSALLLVVIGLLVYSGCARGNAAEHARKFDPWTMTARYEIEAIVDLGDLGETARLWIPAPSDTPFQRVISRTVTTAWNHRETVDRFGNRMIYAEPSAEVQGGVLTARYVVERSPARATGLEEAISAQDRKRYLAEQTRIPLNGMIADLAAQHGAGIDSDRLKSRAFYDYVLDTMRYSKDGEGWGRGDAIWACTAKYGNCTDFHSLLIGLNRSAGIPARFLIGLPVPASLQEGEIPGYHCWAEIAHGEAGWLPVDASEAWKAKKFDEYYGALPSDRVEFSRGRDLVLEPPQKGEPLNFFIYPYAEVDGQAVEKVPVRFRFKRLAMEES